ncbi:hypothetical protein QJS04_geneDACA012501 [Acorus gramineus]|uniref:Uncharacterized protein n=1 Tax=Acorus gramineus TaxID=55184 RepID=A0AAV9B8V4_ACOGR|nr:hypothetical protein QJS04_geneDACA012501 [Acorus gramineus]
MGNVMGFMGKGVPGVLSFPRDRIFDQCFKDVNSFEEFHLAFIDTCNKFNSIMPGRHFEIPSLKHIEMYYEEWKNKSDEQTRKAHMVDLLTKHMKPSKTGKAMVLTGLVAPSAAMAMKRAVEGSPQTKKFRVNMVPDVVFVPSVTLLALLGAKWYNRGTVVNGNQNGERESEGGGGGGEGQRQSQKVKQEDVKESQTREPPREVTSRTVST